eukprot:1729022-Prymnesium_polylepis.1
MFAVAGGGRRRTSQPALESENDHASRLGRVRRCRRLRPRAVRQDPLLRRSPARRRRRRRRQLAPVAQVVRSEGRWLLHEPRA